MNKKMISVQIDTLLLERLKNAVFWLPGLTIRTVIEDGISQQVDKFEQENNDQPFKQRANSIKTGRRMKC